jgi:hypothetical protein
MFGVVRKLEETQSNVRQVEIKSKLLDVIVDLIS